MKIGGLAALCGAGLIALGCADPSSNSPTDPGLDVRYAKPVAAACDAGVSRTADSELKALLSGASLTQAQARWSAVKSACSAANPDAANAALMSHVAYLRGLYPAGILTPKKGTKEGNFLAHLNTAFFYVGYAVPNIPGGSAGPLQAGILVVIPASGGIREYQLEHLGAFMLPEQSAVGDQRGHLFAMYPGGTDCLSVDNLPEVASCVQLNSYPDVSPAFVPGIKVGICVPEGLPQAGLVLGHETPGGTEVAGQSAYPADCHVNVNIASSAGLLRNFANRFAAVWRNTLGVQTAYATDKGLGGIGSILSPWSGLNALVFASTFDAPHAVNAPPVKTVGNYVFEYSVTPPGSIVVRSSLGNHAGPLVVLSQGGGACSSCGGLEFKAKFFSASGVAADDGVYEINWTSLQASPSVKGAPFVVRDGAGLEVARLTYFTDPAGNKLLYNGALVGTWVRNVPQHFKITVDLNANTTKLRIGSTDVVTGAQFVNPAANSIASFSAEYTGIDSGIMGLDDIGVQRISDQPAGE